MPLIVTSIVIGNVSTTNSPNGRTNSPCSNIVLKRIQVIGHAQLALEALFVLALPLLLRFAALVALAYCRISPCFHILLFHEPHVQERLI